MYVEIECDQCGKRMRWSDIVPKYTVVLWARNCGWSVGRRVLCRTCREEVGNRYGNF